MKNRTFSKYCIIAISCCLVTKLEAQLRRFTFFDAETNARLAFVSIAFHNIKVNYYSDSAGVFEIDGTEVPEADSVTFHHINRMTVAIKSLPAASTMKLQRTPRELEPVTVRHCNTPLVKRIEWPRRARHHTSVSPALTIVFVGTYENKAGVSGYLHRVGFHVADYSSYIHIPVRLRWYEWNEQTGEAGRELTDTSIVFMPKERGWNYFTLPDRTVPVNGNKLVVGLEFIYPTWMNKEYKRDIGKETDTEWRKRRFYWFLGMEKPHGPRPKTRWEMVYEKVALRIEMKTCR